MSQQTQLHVVRKADLIAPRWPFSWHDPEGLAALTPEKKFALLENPLSLDAQDPVQIIGTLDGRVIGRLDLFASRITLDGQDLPILWTSSLAVPEEFRKTLMGALLVIKMQSLCPHVGACGVSRMALPVFEKLKWADFTMRRYLLIRRSRSIVERYVGRGPHAWVGALLTDAGLLLQRGMLGTRSALRRKRLSCVATTSLPPQITDHLAPPPGVVAQRRSPAWFQWALNHRFENDPRFRTSFFLLHDAQDQPVAYFLVRSRFYPTATHRGFKNLTLGTLADWGIVNPQRVDLLDIVLAAVRVLGSWGVDAVEICLPQPPEEALGRSLRRMGFIPAGVLHLLFRAAPNSPLANAQFRDQNHWCIRPADGDNIFG